MQTIISILLVTVFSVNANFCVNKTGTIHVYGDIYGSMRRFFATLSLGYQQFRQNYNVTVKIDYSTSKKNQYVTKGMVGGDTSSKKPVLFALTPYIVPLHDNDVAFPVLANGLAIIYNVPEISTSNMMNLSMRALARIYRGNITTWDHYNIVKYNNNTKKPMPNKKIIVIARSDDDISTASLTNYFTKVEPEWNSTYGTFGNPNITDGVSTAWPSNTIYMFGEEAVGVLGIVKSVPYSIGYATIDVISDYNAKYMGLTSTNDVNGLPVSPTVDNIQKSMYNFVNSTSDDMVLITGSNGKISASADPLPSILYFDMNSYPLATYLSLVINYTYDSKIDCCQLQEMVGFIDWWFLDENDGYMGAVGFVPIISEMKERVKQHVLNKVRCENGTVYNAYLVSMQPKTISIYTMSIWMYMLIIAFSCLVVSVAIFIAYYVRKQNYINERHWLIEPKRIKIWRERNGRSYNGHISSLSHLSLNSLSFPNKPVSNKLDNHGTKLSSLLAHKMIKRETMLCGSMDETSVYLDKMCCKFPSQWSASTKKNVYLMKNLNCNNLTAFFGITVIEAIPYCIFEHCSKGSLHYVVTTSRYNLTDDIKNHFVLQIASGLKFLHGQGIVHGFLNSNTCYLDGSWTVKVSNWQQKSIYKKENMEVFTAFMNFNEKQMEDDDDLIKMLYLDPQLNPRSTEAVDAFSFGFIMLEIFGRNLPYAKEVESGMLSYSEILSAKFCSGKIILPDCEKLLPNTFIEIFKSCTKAASESRLTVTRAFQIIAKHSKKLTGIIDIIMETMEKHADDLEEKVNERTKDLTDVTSRMRTLLNELLPPQIANQLLAGHVVMPEQYECVSVYFSDIVGFTTISAKSSPIEVMSFLNDLWLGFDNIIEKFDVYKVDTIGDAYMVCSGLPVRNGMEHIRQIALLSLALREMCKRFKIKHLPNENLTVRIGVNSGPVTAGVVGSKMPQYCVFGDTVNTASRMESTSEQQKIQLSENSFLLLNNNFERQFEMEYRGEINVKGKGAMRTYWLLQ